MDPVTTPQGVPLASLTTVATWLTAAKLTPRRGVSVTATVMATVSVTATVMATVSAMERVMATVSVMVMMQPRRPEHRT